ncbi:MAG: MarR family winged helix-turn-helix transcriptional regulator [Microthrixaceae bacterium]
MSGEPFVPDPLLVAVRRLGTVLDGFDESVARELGVARSDLRALHLLEQGPVHAGDIAAQLELTSGSVTALIRRLVDAALVTRTVDPEDRRVVNVELRHEAWGRLASVYGPAGQRVTACSDSLSKSERRVAVSTLEDVAAVLESLLGERRDSATP